MQLVKNQNLVSKNCTGHWQVQEKNTNVCIYTNTNTRESELWKQELYRALTGGRYKERGSIAVPQTTQLTKIRSPVTDWALLIFSNKPTGQPNFNILVKFLNRSSRKRLAQARNMKDISNRPSPFERKTFDQRARWSQRLKWCEAKFNPGTFNYTQPEKWEIFRNSFFQSSCCYTTGSEWPVTYREQMTRHTVL